MKKYKIRKNSMAWYSKQTKEFIHQYLKRIKEFMQQLDQESWLIPLVCIIIWLGSCLFLAIAA